MRSGEHLEKKGPPRGRGSDRGRGVLAVPGLGQGESECEAVRQAAAGLLRFCRFVWGGRRVADIDALEVTGAMLEAWRNKLRGAKAGGDPDAFGLDPQSLLHAETSIRHAFNWATKHHSPTAYLPVTFRPFGGVERTGPPQGPDGGGPPRQRRR